MLPTKEDLDHICNKVTNRAIVRSLFREEMVDESIHGPRPVVPDLIRSNTICNGHGWFQSLGDGNERAVDEAAERLYRWVENVVNNPRKGK